MSLKFHWRGKEYSAAHRPSIPIAIDGKEYSKSPGHTNHSLPVPLIKIQFYFLFHDTRFKCLKFGFVELHAKWGLLPSFQLYTYWPA